MVRAGTEFAHDLAVGPGRQALAHAGGVRQFGAQLAKRPSFHDRKTTLDHVAVRHAPQQLARCGADRDGVLAGLEPRGHIHALRQRSPIQIMRIAQAGFPDLTTYRRKRRAGRHVQHDRSADAQWRIGEVVRILPREPARRGQAYQQQPPEHARHASTFFRNRSDRGLAAALSHRPAPSGRARAIPAAIRA
jgi:hypothetical protein